MGLYTQNTQGGLMKFFTEPGKYIKDFKIEETTDKKGHIRRKAVYTGTWIVPRNPGSNVQVKLWAVLVFSVLLAAMYVRTVLLTHLTSNRLEVMIPLLLGLFPLLYLLIGALSLPFRGKPMRRDQYMHSFIRVSRSCVAVSAFALLALLITMILRAVWSDWSFFPEDWKYTALSVLVLLPASSMILLLHGIETTEKDNSFYKNTVL